MKRLAQLFLLILIAAGLFALDPWALSLSPLARSAPWLLLLTATIDVLILTFALSRARGSGIALAGRLALLFFGVKTAVVAVESIYLPEVLPPAWIPGLLFNGALTALLLSLAAVWLNGRWPGEADQQPWFPWASLSWWRFPLIGLGWLFLFVGVGLLVFQPLARALDAAAAEAYLNAFMPQNPLLILAFQALRGLFWAIMAWPFLNVLNGGRRGRGFVLGLLFAGLMGSAQLQGIEFLPQTIWPAHLMEVLLENFLFGFVVAWGLWPVSPHIQPKPTPTS